MREARELAFIENLAKLLSELLRADHVMIAEVFDDAPETAQIVTFYSRGEFQPPVSYELNGSPCEQVLSTESCVFREGVCESFPQDAMLQHLGAASYIGVPMLTADQNKLGLLAILNDQPADYDSTVLELLQVAAAQAAAELAQLRISRNLQESQRRLQTLMNSLPGMAYRCKNDEHWTMEIVSRGVFDLTGYRPQDLIQNKRISWARLIHPEDQNTVNEAIEQATLRHQYFRIAYRIICADDQIRWVWEQGKGVENAEGKVTHFEGFILDVTEQHQHQEHIAEIAFRDELTGLANRAALLDHLQNEYEHNPQQDYLLVLLDLKYFRNVNERFGLHAGDRLLRLVAQRLQDGASSYDDMVEIARVTGDEFVVLVKNSAEKVEQFLTVAGHLKQFFDTPLLIGEHQLDVHLRMSGSFSYRAESAAELLQQASIAMYEAKQHELNYCVFDEALQRKVSAERHQTERFLQALAQGELSIALQPQIDLATGQCVGAEALCRWHDQELGHVSPGIFIDIARKQGVLAELGIQVLTKTCSLMKQWQQRYGQLPKVSVNVGAQQFAAPDVVEDFLSICKGIDAQAVTLEITESDLMIDPQLALTVTRRLRDHGFRLAIDDFGTGYSSLAYLQQFAVDILKIDMSFVQAMIKDESSKTLVNTIIAMAQTLGLETIAEGIETAEQAQLLKELGCQGGQGYYFGRPVPPEEFAKTWLE
ncbi:bifunctional diguanylate cyclase/phosphodiesterase [Pseudidiomarina sp. CB1]|uniref:putative bifunctional diguanylate cyclase/phosphodiesterase n=1 Tax=Pseudidiomarina sp. CB1 TaxID=2972484 RepID=UPI00216341C2|nr:GGDEF and EAL domain-containing protein [Pseudidiomarina sp. CB1]